MRTKYVFAEQDLSKILKEFVFPHALFLAFQILRTQTIWSVYACLDFSMFQENALNVLEALSITQRLNLVIADKTKLLMKSQNFANANKDLWEQ